VEPTDEFLDILPMITGEFESFVRGRGYDLYRIREYMPEIPPATSTGSHGQVRSLKVRNSAARTSANSAWCSTIVRPNPWLPKVYEKA